MKENIFISVPVDYLKKEENLLKKYKFNLEIKIFSTHLEHYDYYDLREFYKFLRSLNSRCTFHAPFIDMSPGSFDSKIREVTLERFIKTIDIAIIFKPENVVFHPGFIDYIHGWFFERWIDESLKTWKEVKSYCEKAKVNFCIENVFDKDFKAIDTLIKKINSENCGFCFDVGHHNVFGKIQIEDWFKRFKAKIFEVHIHDNDGTFDYHKAVGDGNIDFIKVFRLIKKYSPHAILTLEAHDKETMLRSYYNVKKLLEKI